MLAVYAGFNGGELKESWRIQNLTMEMEFWQTEHIGFVFLVGKNPALSISKLIPFEVKAAQTLRYECLHSLSMTFRIIICS